ncbi:poly-beta-1,6 N-acetyl-D-glucosamine export porin PgaA [Xanthomonas oryzae]|uniref:poly-beta-1,6 N-acetyl-D-glucosamine export porin PgaA n=1 Tax=Xanthomonas oryzae TaxID=347 RepID=UPI0003F8A347|nr:poly-beta-1,6 N-acetyl-D-glucosamine export porin PgaA [Xanthomonas oryzae]ALS95947.1 hemin storage protein [Xanthomonas oryzae pv. oryzae]AUI89557.1 poly-beta-1,6 N-acetyl-D-glucosamine export porin PgaA [Xanthomonas oryzae pv. oryzae]AUI93235.1 poly-beta-1,6 N-acetyl-D-glucosamine export porin PgaA [Xanthomonas oryzae pv. oryzae]AUI96906.1 poly-beta-1,6 N-acetyl-D-glucosamine export porin PgaA [Xanthomonas oryzae pv. oryzae]AUJ00577.1 poly-beta-1,6 N-acetyl-D-glucosamine export porin PgaA
MTVRKVPLAVCVCLTCATVTPGGHAATSSLGASRADRLAEIGRYRDQARWVDALAAIERAQSEQSDDALLYKLQTLTLSDIGNAWLAWQLCKARPDLFDQDQKAHLESNYLAKLVNWSLAYGESEDTRLTEAEDALAQMEQYVQREARPPAQVPLRIRMDRLILLNRLGRHSQVRDEANALQQEGHPLPDYVLPAVSDSTMATRQPAEAIPLLKTVLKNEPGRSQSRSQLVYAYLETEQAEKAIDYLQSWKKDEPAWRWGGGKSRYANWARYEADLNMAMIHAYSGDLPTAQRALEGLLAVGPGNGGLQTALGSVYQMRGWPRRALERHQMAYTLDPRDVSPRVGMYESYIQLQRDDLARPLHDSLLARYPNQPSVLHMDRDWRAHGGWQLQAAAEGSHSSSGGGNAPLGNNDQHYSMEADSPILDDRWRLFASADRRSVTFQNRYIAPLWLSGGVRYRFGHIDAEAAMAHPGDNIGQTGLRASVGWQFNDQWHARMAAARNDAEASMQARISGITADSMALALDYTRDERMHWRLGGSQFRYDDGNRRDTISSAIEQRLLSQPRLLIDGLGSVYASRGSRDDAPYFNPSHDRSMELGLRINQQLWRHYERGFRQRLTVSVGDYWQQRYGSSLIPSVAYRHEWQLGQGRTFEYGASWSRPVYDGRRERHLGVDAAMHWGE